MTEIIEQPNYIQTPIHKIYTDKEIWRGTFFGGPIVAGYLISENFKAFNERDKVKTTWIFAIIATLMLVELVLLIPSNIKVPNILIPLIYTGITSLIVQRYQGKKIKEHINAAGPTYHWGRTIVVGLIGAILTILPFLGYVYYTNPTLSASSKSFGNLKHEILFDKNNISENEVNQIAESLTRVAFFDDNQQKSVYLKKEKEKYIVFISLIDNAWNEQPVIKGYQQMRTEMQTDFQKNKIAIYLCQDLDKIKKRLE